MRPELVFDAKATLGEGPAWDSKTQSLYWVDILQKKIYRKEDCLAELDSFIGCLAPSTNRTLILGLHHAVSTFDIDSRRVHLLTSIDFEPTTNRINDGKCDPAGRFIFGTMDMNEKDPSGSLYSFDGKQVTRLLDNIRISNGLAWSPDHKTFYYVDTPTREVKAFDYDLSTGRIANSRVVIYVPESLGFPDGMTSDMQGNLWIALWGGAQVTKWDPNAGQLLEQIPVPALQTSACVFGGANMNELYITSARVGMSETDLKKYPLSGGLFKVITNVVGMRTFKFSSASHLT